MTRRMALLLLALPVPLAAAPAPGRADPAPRDPPIEELMRQLARIGESTASFTERKTVAALTRPVVTHGRLAYRRPDYLEKVTAAPNAETLVVKGSSLTYAAGEQAPRQLDLDQMPAVRALVDTVRGTLAGDLATLRSDYTVTMQGDLKDWRLTLVPRAEDVAQYLRQVVIGGTGTALRSVAITQANGDASVMTIDPDS